MDARRILSGSNPYREPETGVRLCCDKNVFVLSECVRLCPTSGHAQVVIWGLLETVGS